MMKKLQEEKINIQDERIKRSFLRLECKKAIINQAQCNIEHQEEKLSNTKKKSSSSLIQSMSTANDNMNLAIKHLKIAKYKLYHCQ